jgi:hypothetical protein
MIYIFGALIGLYIYIYIERERERDAHVCVCERRHAISHPLRLFYLLQYHWDANINIMT